MVVLGISLGSRTTGIAIIKDNELLVARSLTLRNKQTDNHMDTLGNYILQYKILVVVIKLPPITHITNRLKELLHQCIALFQYHGCMVEYKESAEIKMHMPELKNKLHIINYATAQYTDLLPYQSKELANKQKYHIKMFEAVIIAHIKHAECNPRK